MKMKLDMNPEGLGHFVSNNKQRYVRVPLVLLQGRRYSGEILWGYNIGTGNIPNEKSALEMAAIALQRALNDVQCQLNQLSGPAVSGSNTNKEEQWNATLERKSSARNR